MSPIDIVAIEHQARRLRAQEIQRIQGLVAARVRVYLGLLGATALSGLTAAGKALRPLFSWNPQSHRPT